METDFLTILKLIFYLLAAAVVLLPPRWGVPLYLVVMQFDISTASTGFLSATEIGLENTVRVLLLPALLLVRMRLRPLRNVNLSWAAGVWIALVAYAATASLWSSFQIAAWKMVGYLLSYLFLFVIFSYAIKRSWLCQRTLLLTVWAGLVIAVVQTYVLPSGYVLGENRFSSFGSPQSFAAYLLSVLALLLFCGSGGFVRALTLPSLILGILLTGSRYILIGLLVLLVLYWTARMFASRSIQGALAVFSKGVAGVLLVTGLIALFLYYQPESRLHQLLAENPYGLSSLQNVGTLVWRMGVYENTIRAVGSADTARLIFGAGTSNGAEFMLEYGWHYRVESIDANRMLHNEFLRSLYEWGIVGLTLLVGFVCLILVAAARRVLKNKSKQALVIIGIFPAMLFSLSIENILAGAGGPAGAGYAMVLAWGFAAEKLSSDKRRPARQVAPGSVDWPATRWMPAWPPRAAQVEIARRL